MAKKIAITEQEPIETIKDPETPKEPPVSADPVNIIEPKKKHKDPPPPREEETDQDLDFSPLLDHIDKKFEAFQKGLTPPPIIETKKETKKEIELGGKLKDEALDMEGWF